MEERGPASFLTALCHLESVKTELRREGDWPPPPYFFPQVGIT